MAGFHFEPKGHLSFRKGTRYEVTRLDSDKRDKNRKYKAKFAGITDNLVIFDKGPYKVCEKRKNYRKTWKVRML